MPLLTFDLLAGRTPEQVTTLLDAAHDAMVSAFGVPERDRYQLVNEHPPTHLVVQDTGLGFERTRDVVVVQMTSRPRSQEQKEAFYRLLVENLESRCGIAPTDVMVSVRENTDADWSFGEGKAQFLTGDL
jgi:phenylpyruvate tautomerase PptA (4-oxalocrotonate tautomerase family)